MLIHHYPKNQVLRKIAHFHRYWPKYGKHLGSFARFENMFSDFLTNRLAAHKNTMKTRHPKIRQGRHPSSRRDDPSNQHIGDWDTENGARSTSVVPERDAFDLSDINAALRDIDTFPTSHGRALSTRPEYRLPLRAGRALPPRLQDTDFARRRT